MDNINFKDFENWMNINTNLSNSSIKLYVRTLKNFCSLYDKLTVDNINAFVSKSFRESRSYYVKYMFKHFMLYKNMPTDDEGIPQMYKEIVHVKIRPRKKMGNHLSGDIINKIISNIKEQKYRDIATLQYAVGCRARGILSLQSDKIEFRYSPTIIRMVLYEKRGKERPVFLDKLKYEQVLKRHLSNRSLYLFLPSSARFADEKEIDRFIETTYRYYYDKLSEAAAEFEIKNFGTHDLRRNFADTIRRDCKDPYEVKKIMGHEDIRTTERYFKDNPESARDIMLRHQRGEIEDEQE